MKLTHREHDVIILIAKGYADKEIANKLKLSVKTVRSHVNSLFLKMHARNRANAAALFMSIKYKQDI